MKRRVTLLILAASSIASSAPPAHAQLSSEAAETLGRHLEAGVEAMQRLGEAGETLTRLSSGSFGGMGLTGSQRRTMSRRVDAAMQPWRDVAENVRTGRGAMAFTVASQLLTLADEGAAFLGSAYGGDIRGATSTAVSVAVEPVAVGAFTAIGTGVGATVGSFVPVLGNALGGVVGGAVGTVVGGYIGAYAYDKYVKELVTRGAEGGIATLFDTSPQQQAMQARQAFLHQNASPEVRAEWDRMNAISRSFGSGEGQVLDWERLPYVIGRQPQTPPSSAAAPAPEQQAALTTGNVLAGVRRFKIGDETWSIEGGVATHRIERSSSGNHQIESSRGAVSVNRIDGTTTRDWRVPGIRGCMSVIRETQPFAFVFRAETMTGEFGTGAVQILSDTCNRGWRRPEPFRFTSPWGRID